MEHCTILHHGANFDGGVAVRDHRLRLGFDNCATLRPNDICPGNSRKCKRTEGQACARSAGQVSAQGTQFRDGMSGAATSCCSSGKVTDDDHRADQNVVDDEDFKVDVRGHLYHGILKPANGAAALRRRISLCQFPCGWHGCKRLRCGLALIQSEARYRVDARTKNATLEVLKEAFDRKSKPKLATIAVGRG